MISIKAPINPSLATYSFKVTLPGEYEMIEYVSYSYSEMQSCKAKLYDDRGMELFLKSLSLKNIWNQSGVLVRCRIEYEQGREPCVFNLDDVINDHSVAFGNKWIYMDDGIINPEDEFYSDIYEDMCKHVPALNDAEKIDPNSFKCRVHLQDLSNKYKAEDELYEVNFTFEDDGKWDGYVELYSHSVKNDKGEWLIGCRNEFDKYRDEPVRFLIQNGLKVEYIGYEEEHQEATLKLYYTDDSEEVLRFNGRSIYDAILNDPEVEDRYGFAIWWHSRGISGYVIDIGFLLDKCKCSNVVLLNSLERLKRVGRSDRFEIDFSDEFMRSYYGEGNWE